MQDFENRDNNQDNNSSSHIGNRESRNINEENSSSTPGYDFWAERVVDTVHSEYNQEGNYGQSADGNGDNAGKRPKRIWFNKRVLSNKYLRFVVLALCFGLIASFSFVGVQKIYYAFHPAEASQGLFMANSKDYNIQRTGTGKVKTKSSSAINNVIKETESAIVSIDCLATETTTWFGEQYDQEVQGSGSGIIVAKNDKELMIATNNHVVAGAKKISVTFSDETKAAAIIKGTDAVADLAVITVDISKLKEDTLNKIKVASLGNSDKTNEGEMVIAIGNALGYGQSTTVGYISAKDREVEVSDTYSSKKMILLQTDAAINPGNSGGALLNIDGEVIGINTVKYASNEVEGMGYAIPITRANPIIKELMSRKIVKESEQGYLGIAGEDVTEEVSSRTNMPIGVYVSEVMKDGAVKKAGLIVGDIITKANDVEITSITQLRDYVTCFAAGTKIKITYMRGKGGSYKKKEVTVTLGKKPAKESSDAERKDEPEKPSKDSEDKNQDKSNGVWEIDPSTGSEWNPFEEFMN